MTVIELFEKVENIRVVYLIIGCAIINYIIGFTQQVGRATWRAIAGGF